MLRAASCVFVGLLATASLSGFSVAQTQSQQELREAGEARDARLRDETRKRIQEQVERDEARGKERAGEQRRRAGVPEPETAEESSPPALTLTLRS